jgi:metal-responsive CopG/Arc/MetJ family transcriptional regulator
VTVKTSVLLPDDLLSAIDRTGSNRSEFLEKAAWRYLAEITKAHQETTDAALLDQFADHLNEEAADVLEYQCIPE